MSLFGAIQQSANALRLSQLGLQVVGNNIANANTPGYIRQELVQATAVGNRYGDAIVGNGARAVGVVQKIDNFVVQRMRDTISQLAYNQQLGSANAELETIINELGDNDLSTLMSSFSSALHDLANQPGNASLKSLVLQRGEELASGFKSVATAAQKIQATSIQEIGSATTEINRITKEIAYLNTRIVEMEGGRTSGSDAVGLRDERLKSLDELAEYVNINAVEQANGSVTVIVGGDYLVADGIPREVKTHLNSAEGSLEVRFADTDSELEVTGGKLRGYYDSRDAVGGNFLAKIDQVATDVIQTVNRIHSQGQGSVGLQHVVGDYQVTNEFAPFEQSGLTTPIDNGSFTIKVIDARTGLTTSHDLFIKQQGLPSDTTMNDLVSQLDAISGVTAKLSNDGRLVLDSDSDAISFSFEKDSSGILGALGVNTFFRGNSSATIEVKPEFESQPNLLAVSLNGIGNGADNALNLATAFETSFDYLGGQSIQDLYQSAVVETTQKINAQKGVSDGLLTYFQSLQAAHLGTSGVNLNEEAINMMQYQRSFQATSKLISTANEMLDTLVNML